MSDTSRIWTPIDFDADGKQVDVLRIPFSTDKSAYGWQPVPIVVIKRGTGPTLLLTAGTHGDEWEGQVALRRLAATLEADRVSGRVIIMPSLNYAAACAGRRVSPLDEGNLNRLFPGRANGSPTEMIAHYVHTVLFPLSDAAIDLHAGGRSLDYLPVAYAHEGSTPELKQATRALLNAFDAPHSVLTSGSAGGGATTLYASATASGISALTVELGGAGTLQENGLDVAERGLRRSLNYLGIVGDDATDMRATTRFYRAAEQAGAVYAPGPGIFRPAVTIGDSVIAGQLAGELYSFPDVLAPPIELRFRTAGTILSRRFPSHTEHGDSLYTLASPWAA